MHPASTPAELPSTHNITTYIHNAFIKLIESVKADIESITTGHVATSMDLWSIDQTKASFLGLTAHWIEAMQPSNLACYDDDKQNARLANHVWKDNGLNVPEDFLDKLMKAQQCARSNWHDIGHLGGCDILALKERTDYGRFLLGEDIHEATQDAPKAIMGNMSGWHQAHSHFLIDGVLLALTTITTTAIIPHLTGTLTDTHGQVKAAANKSPCGSCKDDERSVSSPEDIIHALHQSLSSGAGAAWITGMRDGRQEESRSNCWQSLPLPLMYLVLVDPVPEAHATAAKALGALVECLREGHFPDIDSGLVRPIPQAFIDKLPHHSGLLIHPFYHLTAARPGPTTSQLQVAPALLHDVIEITTDEEILSQVSVIEIMTTDDKDASQMPVHAHRELAITPVVPSSDALYDEADHATDIAPASPFPGPAEFRFMAESGSKALPDKTDRVTGPLAVLKVHLRAVITRKIALAIIIFAVPFLVKDSHLLQLTNHLVFAVESGVKSFTSALVNEV
ncbi:hypothetical protein BD769DRAFT_1661685 [Suillus cothurnatus]|nr:hypothetical protein BD769DRAFT_1661685 [Suillus cothurnatus]